MYDHIAAATRKYEADYWAERTGGTFLVYDAAGELQAWPKDMVEAEMMLTLFPGGRIVEKKAAY